MPCYDSYMSPYDSVSFDLVSEIVTRIFGLTNNSEPTEHEYHLSERKQLSNYERIEKYKKHLRRAFILCMKGNYISGLFIPHQLEVDYYNDQLLQNYLVDENYSVCEKEINICKDEKSGKFHINVESLRVTANEYNHHCPTASEKNALLEKWMSLMFIYGFKNSLIERKSNVVITKTQKNQTSPFNKLLSIFKKKKQNSTKCPEKEINYKTLLKAHNLLCCIFEYIDSVELINNVASVCPQFHELIIFNNGAGNQIFGGRILNYLKKKLDFQMKDLKTLLIFHQTQSFTELYLLSGMIFIEYFEKELKDIIPNNGMYSEIFLILDPLMLIENQSVINLLEKKRKKIILISEQNKKSHENVTNTIPFPSSEESFLKSIIFSPLLKRQVSFEKGIPLYVRFLQDLTLKLKNAKLIQEEKLSNVFQYVAQKILEKAKYFLKMSKFENFTYAPDDVLLGLHFILLDNYFDNNNCNDMVYLNFTNLLENRKKPLTYCITCEYPQELRADFLQILISGDFQVPSNHQFDPNLFFPNSIQYDNLLISELTQQVDSIKQFLQEVIFDLSDVIVNNQHSEEYIDFLKRSRTMSLTITKEQDVYYHFHMLHSISFYQDCKEIAQYVGNHVLDFPKNIPRRG